MEEINYLVALKYPGKLIIVHLDSLEVRVERSPCPSTSFYTPVSYRHIFFAWKNRAILYDHLKAKIEIEYPPIPKTLPSMMPICYEDKIWLFSGEDIAYVIDMKTPSGWEMESTGFRTISKNYCFLKPNSLAVIKSSLLSDTFGCRFGGLQKDVNLTVLKLDGLSHTQHNISLPFLGPFGCVSVNDRTIMIFGGYDVIEDSSFKLLSENLKIVLLNYERNTYEQVGSLPYKLDEPCIFQPPLLYKNCVYSISSWQLVRIEISTNEASIFSLRELSKKVAFNFLWIYKQCTLGKATGSLMLDKLPLSIIRAIVADYYLPILT
ncbi:unnamed protein product [Blepharisma stoltei]|uniref:Uncharacterized protein n=1 Tax=Blepharisma stoltei TaxID=1481888 RepID=A0AAU9J141_9CILI|nr:unnamed protein product [Blepharisma stoltei]